MNLAIDLVAILMQNAIGARGQNPMSLMTPENTAHSCQNCRWSRVRCDSTRPACRRCAFDGVDCLGYGPPLLWVQPETLHGQHIHGNGSGNGSISRLSRKRGRPKLVLAKSRTQPISRRVDMDGSFAIFSTSKDKLVKPPLPCPLPRGLAPANDADVNFTLHCLLYFNTHICPDVVAVDSPENPHRIDVYIWHLIPDFLLSMLNAISITHQIIRSQPLNVLLTDNTATYSEGSAADKQVTRLESFHHPLITKVYRYQHQALQGINGCLQIMQTELTDMAIALIALLLMAQVQQSAHGVWWAHWKAIRQLVGTRGGFTEIVNTNSSLHNPLSLFMLIDVMSCITKPSGSIGGRISLQLEYLEHLPTIYHDGTDTGFPCPNELVECIIRINHLRATSCLLPDNDADINSRILSLVQQIVSFSPAIWIHRANLVKPRASLPGRDNVFHFTGYDFTVPANRAAAVEEGGWLCLGFMFQAAVLLYSTRCLILDRGIPAPIFFPTDLAHGSIIDVHDLRSAADDMLFNGFRRFFSVNSRQDAWIGKFLYWPLFIAGMECCSGSESSDKRELVTQALGNLASYLGDLSLIDAVSFLRSQWQMESDMWRIEASGERSEQALYPRTWDDKISLLRENSVFFI